MDCPFLIVRSVFSIVYISVFKKIFYLSIQSVIIIWQSLFLNYFVISFYFERTWRRHFRKVVVSTELHSFLYIYVFTNVVLIRLGYTIYNCSVSLLVEYNYRRENYILVKCCTSGVKLQHYIALLV